jgi:hypothetical protein
LKASPLYVKGKKQCQDFFDDDLHLGYEIRRLEQNTGIIKQNVVKNPTKRSRNHSNQGHRKYISTPGTVPSRAKYPVSPSRIGGARRFAGFLGIGDHGIDMPAFQLRIAERNGSFKIERLTVEP